MEYHLLYPSHIVQWLFFPLGHLVETEIVQGDVSILEKAFIQPPDPRIKEILSLLLTLKNSIEKNYAGIFFLEIGLSRKAIIIIICCFLMKYMWLWKDIVLVYPVNWFSTMNLWQGKRERVLILSMLPWCDRKKVLEMCVGFICPHFDSEWMGEASGVASVRRLGAAACQTHCGAEPSPTAEPYTEQWHLWEGC